MELNADISCQNIPLFVTWKMVLCLKTSLITLVAMDTSFPDVVKNFYTPRMFESFHLTKNDSF